MTLDQVAAVFRVTEKAVRDWIDAGMPVKKLGKQGRGDKTDVDLEEAVRWYFETNHERLELDRQRAGLAYEQRRKAALENAEQVGDLARISVITKAFADAVATAQALLLAIPTKEAPMLVPLNDANAIENRLRNAINDALQQLAAYGTRGTKKRSGRRRTVNGSVRTAGHSKRKRVGRAKPTAQ